MGMWRRFWGWLIAESMKTWPERFWRRIWPVALRSLRRAKPRAWISSGLPTICWDFFGPC